MKALKIGTVTIEKPLILAPMAGITDLPFRLLCKEAGAGMVCTEMVSAKALSYHNVKTQDMLEVLPEERPVSLQLFGSEPEIIAEVTKMLDERNFDILDFNMGCPVPKVVNNGEGSALMKDPFLVEKIVLSMVQNTNKPVTVKIRRGFDEEHVNCVEVAKAAEAGGAAAIAVHGRTRTQYYSGYADRNCIRQVKEAVSIPVIGNGDVTDGISARKMLEETGCDGIMIGRAVRGNPWIFYEIEQYLDYGKIPARPDYAKVKQMILKHIELQKRFKSEYTGVREMRKHISWYTAGLPNSSKMRGRINQVETWQELYDFLDMPISGRV